MNFPMKMVKIYFINEKEINRSLGSEQVTLETTFRGHHLKCNPTELPNEYAGFVYDDAPNPLNLVKNDVFFDMMNDDAEAKRFWKPTSSFKRINVWGHDFPADKDSDPYFCVPSLVNLSEAVSLKVISLCLANNAPI